MKVTLSNKYIARNLLHSVGRKVSCKTDIFERRTILIYLLIDGFLSLFATHFIQDTTNAYANWVRIRWGAILGVMKSRDDAYETTVHTTGTYLVSELWQTVFATPLWFSYVHVKTLLTTIAGALRWFIITVACPRNV